MYSACVKLYRWLLPALLAAGCAVAPPPPSEAPGPPTLPRESYAGREHVYAVDPTQSQVLIHVYREGTLARLGHNHVIRVGDLTGLAQLAGDLTRSRADLAFSAAALEVDLPADRAAGGPDFANTPSKADVEGTRANMLGPKVLDATHHPHIGIEAHLLAREGDRLRLRLRITLRGVAHGYEAEARLRHTGGGEIELSGTLTVAQSDFGIRPFSVLAGAIKVRDRVEIGYRIHAAPVSDP